MAEHRDPLPDLFAGFHDDVAPLVRAEGTAALHDAVRTRRRVRATTLAALTVLVVAIPVAAYAALAGDPNGPPPTPAETPTVAVESTAPSQSASPAPSSAPDGRIDAATLKQATLHLPQWGDDNTGHPRCPSGELRFSGGARYVGDSMSIHQTKVVHTDVDRDGAQETVVRFQCGDQVGIHLVVAFDRDERGAIRTLGTVVRSDAERIRAICDIRVGTAGTVEAWVVDEPTELGCSAGPSQTAITQWRTYGWNGSAFTQTGGPQSFPVNPKHFDFVMVSGTPVTFGTADAQGVRRGSTTLTVRNAGAVAGPYQVSIGMPRFVSPPSLPSGCTVKDWPELREVVCTRPSLAPGAGTTFTLEVTTTGGTHEQRGWQVGVRPVSGLDVDSENNHRFIEYVQ